MGQWIKARKQLKECKWEKGVKRVREKMVERQRKFNVCVIGVIKRKSIYIIWESFSEIREKENLYIEKV